jgi:hypothetical protein
MPWAGAFFAIMSELGFETFYIVLILIGYWSYHKRESMLTAFVLMTSTVSYYWLKFVIANPRPAQSFWYPGVEATNYSTPSGHAQNAATIWGWFALRIRKVWIYPLAIVMVVLIGLSRVYLGVHYLGDVLLGWGIGFLIAVIFFMFYESLTERLSAYRSEYLYGLVFLISLSVLLISTYVLPLPPDDNFGAYAGLLMGLAVALPLEKRFVGFGGDYTSDQPVSKGRLVVRVVIGLIIVIGVLLGLSFIMPTTEPLLRALRYFLVVVVGVVVWPFIFIKAGI